MSKNLSAKCYLENKERLEKKNRQRYQNLSKEEKEKKRQYGRERCKNLSEDEKNKLVDYRKKILYNEKKHFIIIIRKYFNLKNFASCLGKYKKLFSFALMFEKRYKKFLIFRYSKFSPET